MFDEIIDKNIDNILNTTSELIKYESISDENSPNFPFGEECSKALNYILKLGESLGFRTKNIDEYCGYIEFGDGDDLVGIIGHLDVVPANLQDGWSTPPFMATIKDGKLFGRGALDDKGPVVAALYAMKAIKETTKVSKRVRLILGLNEEKSWKCINYYKKVEEWPKIGFSPDANFPAIYAEKGIITVELKNPFTIKNFQILNIDCNNNAINVVPKYCSITLKAENTALIENLLNIQIDSSSLKITKINSSSIKIESYGIASHAAHPELGKNAITKLIEFLLKNFEFDSNYLKKLYEIGIFDIKNPSFLGGDKLQDESGDLTSNVADLEYINNNLIIKSNLRVPVNTTLDCIKNKYLLLCDKFENLEINFLGLQNPLHIEKDSYLVKTLVDIFNEKTKLNANPIAIGGGTYARAFKNFISYGPTMPGKKDMCHQVDEFIEVKDLILSTKIYAEAIYKLAK